ncbi:N-ethylmaleimide reductase [Oxalobacteraceae bacterium GrIS 2.11]
MKSLYDPVTLGNLQLKNRVFMAPLTRNRARPDGVPGELAPTYYRQRASAGLIVSEATQISAMGKGYVNTPGIHSAAQTAGWSQVVQAVHEAGGRIFVQLWHVGRISHSSLLPDNVAPLAPSPIRARSQTVTASGFVDVSEPREMTLVDIRQTVEDYRKAAANAKAAGFDGVEIHAANGYLVDQFLQSTTNRRSDEYGGTAANRVRFLREVLEAVLSVWEPTRVGVRISPGGTFNDMGDENPVETYSHLVEVLNPLGLGYLHVVEASPGEASAKDGLAELFNHLRASWNGVYIVNGGYDAARGEQAIADHRADAISYGRLFLANPDLPKRLQHRGPLNAPDTASFYGGTEHGYIDYPEWTDQVQ